MTTSQLGGLLDLKPNFLVSLRTWLAFLLKHGPKRNTAPTSIEELPKGCPDSSCLSPCLKSEEA